MSISVSRLLVSFESIIELVVCRGNVICFHIVTGYFHSTSIVSAQRTVHKINFNSVTCEEIQSFVVNFSFRIDKTGEMVES